MGFRGRSFWPWVLGLAVGLAALAPAAPASGAAWVAERITPAGSDGYLDYNDRQFTWANANGDTILFGTYLAATPADHDDYWDLYRWHNGETTLVTGGAPGYPNQFVGEFNAPIDDGKDVIFTTEESLVPGDSDANDDVYRANGGDYVLLSGPVVHPAPTSPAPYNPVTFGGATRDGSRVFFSTRDGLVASDVDGDTDLYEWTPEGVDLVSDGSRCEDPDEYQLHTTAYFRGMSSDGSRVVFVTDQQLVPGDTDCYKDVYTRDASGYHLVIPGELDVGIFEVSPDAERILFRTYVPLDPSDQDGSSIYLYDHGVFRWLTPTASTSYGTSPRAWGNMDLSRVLIESWLPLLPSDTDSEQDIYQWDDGALRLLTPGTQRGIVVGRAPASNADAVAFKSSEQLVPEDLLPETPDLYKATPQGIQLLTRDSAGVSDEDCGGANQALMSADGARVFADVSRGLAPNDPCIDEGYGEGTDTYELTGSSSSLVRPLGLTIMSAPYNLQGMVQVTPDGFIIQTNRRISADDTDCAADVFRVWYDPTAPPVASPPPNDDPCVYLDPHPNPDPDPGPGPEQASGGSSPLLGDQSAPTTSVRVMHRRGGGKPPRVRFWTDESATTWCRFDRRKFRVCDSPIGTRNLRPGNHRFDAFSVDRAGNSEHPWVRVHFSVPERGP